MARTPIVKKLQNTNLANEYGGWMYCASCGQTIGYLCYVTYDAVMFRYQCACGSEGTLHIDFEAGTYGTPCGDSMVPIKNRLCCPADKSPLITILGKKLASYHCEIGCTACKQKYVKEQSI